MVHHQKNRERAGQGHRSQTLAAPRTETIAAVATAAGRGALGIVRLSGPRAFSIAQAVAGALPSPRQSGLRHFRDTTGAVLDQGLVLCFAAPASFTGEDVVELQGHGGPVVLAALLATLVEHGARIAQPGEFSERAFLNGRIDLLQAEAIADLIDAASVQAVRAANNTLDGAFSARVHAAATALSDLRVFVEGALDFSDEDIDWLADTKLNERLQALQEIISQTQREAAQGRRLREGLTVAIVGQPNVGKSTLLNALAGFDAAIVSEQAGTTRDVLREHLVLGGMPLTVVDTAGLRDTEDPVEREGIRRARLALDKAELALFVVDDRSGITAADEALLHSLPPLPRLMVRNKCDLAQQPPSIFNDKGERTIRLAAKSGAGLELLSAELQAQAGLTGGGEGLFLARARHLEALATAAAHLQNARQQLAARNHAEIAAEELRLVQLALGRITGEQTSDALLGEIFRRFCIGK